MKLSTIVLTIMLGLCSHAMAQNKDITIKLVETSDVHGSFSPTISSTAHLKVVPWQGYIPLFKVCGKNMVRIISTF